MAWNNVGADGSTARLLKAAQAAALAEDIPKESGRTLVALAKSVRLYLEARDVELAMAKLEGIEKMLSTHDDALVTKAFDTHVSEVRKYVTFQPHHVA